MYVGRFAPSPTGQLHFGSLLAALASYLDARKNNGEWLVRIDDIDPPREQAGATRDILKTLETYGLFWDRETIYQSKRTHHYQETLESLDIQGRTYKCYCSRKQITQRTGANIYDGFCLDHFQEESKNHQIRFRQKRGTISWFDQLQASQVTHSDSISDFVLKRRDGLWSYQIAVATDDHLLGITNVVRGRDLLPETAKQLSIIEALELNTPKFSHIPLAVNENGQKLSKQNLALPLPKKDMHKTLYHALQCLGQSPDEQLLQSKITDIIHWAISHWDIHSIPSGSIYATP